MSVAVVSFYMENIKKSMIQAQKDVVLSKMPNDFSFFQILTSIEHENSIDNFLKSTNYEKVLFLDIDCIPMQDDSLEFLADNTTEDQLIGCAQRASHIENNSHIYAGPFCFGIHRKLWNDLGKPSCIQTDRGDVGEEITYLCEENNKNVKLMWPSSVDEERWPLIDDIKFGIGTGYDNKFWHLFESRRDIYLDMFLNKCKDVIWR